MTRIIQNFKAILTSEPDDLIVMEFYDQEDSPFLTIALATGKMKFKIWFNPVVPSELDDAMMSRVIEHGKITLQAKVSAMNSIELEAPEFEGKEPTLIVIGSGNERTVRTAAGSDVFRIMAQAQIYRWTLFSGESTLIDLEVFEQIVQRIKRQFKT